MKSIKFGEHLVPLWLIVTLLVSGIGVAVLTDYVWKTITMPFEVKEPLEILSYPSELSLYPGEVEELNVTVMNYASRNYTVLLGFSLDNATYQESYVTFSDETYTVVPDEQNLTAWLEVEEYAPPVNASLTIDFMRISAEGEVLFFDDFNDGVADGWTPQRGYTWEVIDGQYVSSLGSGRAISIVDNLTFTDGVIKATVRHGGGNPFQDGIVFRYTDDEHYYSFFISDEYDEVRLRIHNESDPHYGWSIIDWAKYPITEHGGGVSYPINPDTVYSLEIRINGNSFTGYVNGEKILYGMDNNYEVESIGLSAHRGEVFFDNFTVYSLP